MSPYFFILFLSPPSQSSHLLYQHLHFHTFHCSSNVIHHSTFTCFTFFCFPPPPSYFLSSHTTSLTQISFLASPLQVDWPLNIIITDSCMNKYNRLFSFLLQLKHMVWSLRDVWFHLKRTGEGKVALLIQLQLGLQFTPQKEEMGFCFIAGSIIFIEKYIQVLL